MNKNVIYVGIDVDDNSFHVSAFLKESGELIEKKSKPLQWLPRAKFFF